VCGANGNRYDNEQCAVDCQGANPDDLVSCPDPAPPAGEPKELCTCQLDWQPVCDTSNVLVAPNFCAAKCNGYTEEQLLDCLPVEPANPPTNEPCPCTFDFRPVCDYQGFILAPNSCTANCMGYTSKQYADCLQTLGKAIAVRFHAHDTMDAGECVCTMEYDPQCDQYGNEVSPNPCTAECAGITGLFPCSNFTVFHNRIPPANPPKPQPSACTMEYAPVCTQDGMQVGSNMCSAEGLGYSPEQLSPCPVPENSIELSSEVCVCTRELFPQCLPNGTEVGANPCVAACDGYGGQALPCDLLELGQIRNGQPPFTIHPKPPCMCNKELDPYCTVPTADASLSIPAGANKCNAVCNGYSEDEIQPCNRDAIITQATEEFCPCPLNLDPICDKHGTELGANECFAACKGYNASEFSEEYCATPAVAPCNGTMCTADFRPVCDKHGTELASNACEASCKGYEATDFSEEYCSFQHLIKNVTLELSSGDEACRCTREYRPVCDSKGTVVAANSCTARCSGFNPPNFLPCFFIEMGTNSTDWKLIQSMADALEGGGIEFASLLDSSIQTVCTTSPTSSLPMICAAYNSAVGFRNSREEGDALAVGDFTDDSGPAPTPAAAAAMLLTFVALFGQRLL